MGPSSTKRFAPVGGARAGNDCVSVRFFVVVYIGGITLSTYKQEWLKDLVKSAFPGTKWLLGESSLPRPIVGEIFISQLACP